MSYSAITTTIQASRDQHLRMDASRFSAPICQKRGSRAASNCPAAIMAWIPSLFLGAIVGLAPITALSGHVRLTRHGRLLRTANSAMMGAYTRLGQGNGMYRQRKQLPKRHFLLYPSQVSSSAQPQLPMFHAEPVQCSAKRLPTHGACSKRTPRTNHLPRQ